MDKRSIGRFGEDCAVKYLKRHFYSIVDRNFSCRMGEIDVIARKKNFIVFVEVKLRKDASHGEAKEFVTRAKQQKIIAAAETWLATNNTELQPRFDVIEIYAPDGEDGEIRINHIEDAFC